MQFRLIGKCTNQALHLCMWLHLICKTKPFNGCVNGPRALGGEFKGIAG